MLTLIFINLPTFYLFVFLPTFARITRRWHLRFLDPQLISFWRFLLWRSKTFSHTDNLGNFLQPTDRIIEITFNLYYQRRSHPLSGYTGTIERCSRCGLAEKNSGFLRLREENDVVHLSFFVFIYDCHMQLCIGKR